MKKRYLILACGFTLLCGLVLGACKNHNESIDENLLGQWGGEYGPRYVFYENGTYEGYSGIKIVGNYTTKDNKLTLQPPLKYRTKYDDKFSYTYSITDDTLTITTESGKISSYTKLE
ncbi:MAG: DUF5640 domain-containing protein [Peptococcaceae bacterium]|nr:DUF5640 domain-containing protein [Peptococcaceae bacterium]